MKAEELRIGNWIMNGDKPKQVIQINRDGSVMLNPDMRSYVWLSECQPIEISPEILEKAATYAEHSSYWFEFPEIKRKVVVTWYDNEQKRVFLNDNYIGILHLQYVHELQNLIHALTSSELPLNL